MMIMEIGSVIRDKIIPNAVLWFTGGADEDDSIYMQFDMDAYEDECSDMDEYEHACSDMDSYDDDDDDNDEDEYAEDYDVEKQEEEKHKTKIQVQHQNAVVRGHGVAAATATGGASTSAAPGGVAHQFTPMSLYVGDLDINVTDTQLFNQGDQVISVRICRDFSTGRSLGYGFVNYSNPQDAVRGMETFDFATINGKSIRVKHSYRDPNFPKSRTVNLFIRNLEKSIDNKALHDIFSSFGYILSCKVVTDCDGQSKGYGFVQFDNDESAQSGIDKLNDMLINNKKVYVAHALRKEKSGGAQVGEGQRGW